MTIRAQIKRAPYVYTLLILLFPFAPTVAYSNLLCEAASELARNNDYQAAIDTAKKCLTQEDLDNDSKIWGYRSLAWGYSGLTRYSDAVEAQKSVFSLGGRTYHDLINGGIYYRKAGQLSESLDLLLEAKEVDAQKRWVSMMTQYQLGWTYYEMNMYEQAIKEFTIGIPAQPDFSFVYYRRGLAFHSLGDKEKARSDFTKFDELLLPEVVDPRSKVDLKNNLELLEQYGITVSPEIIK